MLPQLPDRPDGKVRVFYQYFYHNDERHVVEKMAGYKCAFCRMVCRSLTVRPDAANFRCNHSWKHAAVAEPAALVLVLHSNRGVMMTTWTSVS